MDIQHISNHKAGAIPVLIDSDQTFGIDPKDLKEKISERTKVIMVIPMLGSVSKIGEIMEVVMKVNNSRLQNNLIKIFVLEDCAQSLGAHAFGILGFSEFNLPEDVTSLEHLAYRLIKTLLLVKQKWL